MTLGEKLQRLRKARGMSQEELAGRLEVSRQAVSRWELNLALPDTEHVVRLSEMFGVTTDYLLKGKEEISLSNAPTGGRRESGVSARLVGGGCLLGGSLLGLAALLVLSVITPVSFTARGVSLFLARFLAFLEKYDLGWLFLLLCAGGVGGGVLLFLPELKRYFSTWE